MRKILIPTDFSENSVNAIKYATELFKHHRSQIYLLHAFADEIYDAKAKNTDIVFETLKEETYLKSKDALESLRTVTLDHSPNPKHNIHIITEFELLIDAVNDWVEKENMDVVVMGTKGHTDDKKLTFGSNTLQIIKYVKCPVLAIPEKYTDIHPKNILFPTDFLLPFKKRELKLVSNIAKSFGANLHFLHLTKFPALSLRQQDNKKLLESCLTDNLIKYHQDSGKDVTTAINEFIEEHPIDMVIMVNTRHSYLENLLYQTTIEKIGLHIEIPFLVLQNLPR